MQFDSKFKVPQGKSHRVSLVNKQRVLSSSASQAVWKKNPEALRGGMISCTRYDIIRIKGSWEGIFRVTDDFYSMKGGVKLYMHEGWCETLHHIRIHSWRAVWDFTSHKNTFMQGGVRSLHHIRIHSWNAAWDFTSHNNTFMEGGVRHYIT